MKLSNRRLGTISLGSIAFAILAGNTLASTVTLPAVNTGFYNIYGQSSQSLGQKGNIGMLGPQVAGGVPLYHNWLAFDLSLIDGTIVAATLEIYSNAKNTSGQGIIWRDVTTPYSQLGKSGTTTADKTLGKQIFADMGSGQIFAQGTHTAGMLNSYTLNSFALNGNAIASLNSTESFWAIAGENTEVIKSPYNFAFGYNQGAQDGLTMQLRVEVADPVQSTSANVPEAGPTVLMLGVGMIGLFALSRRTQSVAK